MISGFSFLCGERGIRTPGPVTVNSFQDCRIRPLCQLSAAKVRTWRKSANDFHSNICINILSVANHSVSSHKNFQKNKLRASNGYFRCNFGLYV